MSTLTAAPASMCSMTGPDSTVLAGIGMIFFERARQVFTSSMGAVTFVSSPRVSAVRRSEPRELTTIRYPFG